MKDTYMSTSLTANSAADYDNQDKLSKNEHRNLDAIYDNNRKLSLGAFSDRRRLTSQNLTFMVTPSTSRIEKRRVCNTMQCVTLRSLQHLTEHNTSQSTTLRRAQQTSHLTYTVCPAFRWSNDTSFSPRLNTSTSKVSNQTAENLYLFPHCVCAALPDIQSVNGLTLNNITVMAESTWPGNERGKYP